ncbi:unnamed protein product [Gongylonema pulchrum]|uniref:Col_cuticle_N domain-containing protein n=1 Tax=Gongylonema pulchrum TaxID=637853 RepID=A0A183EZM9_9BILA|nr:unnamed protein product [Gongylonema pulchrum]
MSAHLAAYSAVGLSICALVACIVFLPSLYNRISEIRHELELDMEEFRELQNEIYIHLKSGSVGIGGGSLIGYRKKRALSSPGQCRM